MPQQGDTVIVQVNLPGSSGPLSAQGTAVAINGPDVEVELPSAVGNPTRVSIPANQLTPYGANRWEWGPLIFRGMND